MKQLYKPLHVVDQELYRKHGRLFGSFEDGKPVLYVAEPDLLKLILVKDSGLTQRKVVEVDDPVMRNVMLNVPPDQWKKLRTATSPAFTSGKLRKMQVIIDSCAQLTSERLKKAATASEDVDLKGFYGHFSLDAVASCSFGVKLSQNSPEEGSFIRSAKNVFFAEVTPYVVLCALFQKLGHTFRKRIFNRKSFEFYKNATIDIIKKREENNIRHEDFLQMMMNAKEVAKQTSASEEKTVFGSDFEGSVPKLQDVKNLTEEEALAQCVLFFLAGQDTASTTASFASYLLAINPHTQEKLQAEVDDCFRKHGSSPSYDVVSKLPYLESVVNETLRVMTPGSRVDRVFHEDYMLGETGIKISKDCVVLIPIYSLHHDPEFFPEPDVFNPDRFSEENIDSIRPYTFLPFGAGPRNCIGSRFAQQLVKTCLLHAVHNVQFVKCPKTKVPLKYRPGFGILSPEDLVVGVRERSS
ncbi:cytochrome P450 3A24-like isoform X3 [Rhipicephalus microplus]